MITGRNVESDEVVVAWEGGFGEVRLFFWEWEGVFFSSSDPPGHRATCLVVN